MYMSSTQSSPAEDRLADVGVQHVEQGEQGEAGPEDADGGGDPDEGPVDGVGQPAAGPGGSCFGSADELGGGVKRMYPAAIAVFRAFTHAWQYSEALPEGEGMYWDTPLTPAHFRQRDVPERNQCFFRLRSASSRLRQPSRY